MRNPPPLVYSTVPWVNALSPVAAIGGGLFNEGFVSKKSFCFDAIE